MKNIYLIFISIFIVIPLSIKAQSTSDPDIVCVGSNTYYKIKNSNEGSTFAWGIYEAGGSIEATSKSDSIRVTWNDTPGIDVLWVVETNNAGCKGDTAKITIIRVAKPTAEFDNAKLCHGETLKINFTGEPPYSIKYTLNGTAVTQNGITDNPYTVGSESGTYKLLTITDKHCASNVLTEQSTAIIGQELHPLQIIHD